MTSAFTILMTIFGLAAIITFILAWLCRKDDKEMRDMYGIACSVFFAITMITGILHCCTKPEKPKEFPAAKYELKYKVTEFEGASDTTYVLIPKKNESK